MATTGKMDCISLNAGADLNTGDGTGAQYKAIAIGGTIAANNSTAIGLLQNKPKNGEDAQIAIAGVMKGVAGGALTAGTRVKITTSGYLASCSSGDGAVGKVITAAASGATCELMANFPLASTTY